MSADELGSGVNYDVCSVLKRTNEIGSSESVIDDERDLVRMCYLSDFLNIGNV